jgi:hypothetical protein
MPVAGGGGRSGGEAAAGWSLDWSGLELDLHGGAGRR